jgi:sulfoquinovosidase
VITQERRRRPATTACALAGALLALAGAAPAAHGAATITDREVVVRDADGGRVVAQRSPFRLTFEDAQGAVVLQQVPNDVHYPLPSVNADPEPGGFDVVPESGLYAPLQFEVGVEGGLQHWGGLWHGNMLAGGDAGVMHRATAVRSAVADGDGARLQVATTDPLRTLTVRLTPDATGPAIRVRATLDRPEGVAAFGDSFVARPGEAFHGFGGRHNTLDHRGRTFYSWIEQEVISPGDFKAITGLVPGSEGDRYLFPNGPASAYYVQNQFVSSKGYGFLLNETSLTRWRLASDLPDAWQVASPGRTLDYTVALGDERTSAATLTSVTGRHRMPEPWAMGPTLKRAVKQGSDNPQTQKAKIEADLAKIEELDLELTAYAYESWATLDPAFVRQVNQRLLARGIHPIGYLRAFVNDDGNFDPNGTFEEATRNGYVARTPGGMPYVYSAPGPAALIDFTNPAAVRWWEGRVRRMLDLGFDGFMQDFGEQVTADMRFHNGETGATMHNRYPVVYHDVTRRILDRYEAEHPGRGRIYMYTRAGFSGRPGSAAAENANFPGDETIGYDRSNGLASLATDMLNRAVGGAYGYTTDIGGYLGTDPTPKELYVRWSQWSALTPFFRVHNGGTAGTRMPWDFDDETLALWREAAALHQRALPYIRALWSEAERTGVPPTRPMWMAAPGDRDAVAADQQWMLGDDVLVAPVVQGGATSRSVWFPAGCWRDPRTGAQYAGAATHTVPAPLGRLPYFFRCGTAAF